MSQGKKQTFTRAEVATIVRNLEKRMEKQFRDEFGSQVAGFEGKSNALDLEQRINEGSSDWMETSNKFTAKVSQIVPRLMLKIHKHFGTIDNFTETYYKPKRNWPLIVIGAIGFSSMLYFADPRNQQSAAIWYATGSNAYILWVAAIFAILGFVYWRQRQKKQVQTGPQ